MTEAAVTETRPDRSTLLAFAGVVLFGGANAIAVRQTVLELSPFWSAAVRFVAAGLILVAIAALARRPLPRGQSLVGAMLYGAIGFAAGFALIYPALRDTPAGTAQVLIALTPLFTFGLAIAHGQERFHAQGLVGALLALVGVAIVMADQLNADVPLISMGFILLGTVSIAESGVIVKWIPRSDPLWTNAVAMLTGAVLLLVLTLVAGQPVALPASDATWLALGYLVVFGSVVMFTLYVYALERWTASAVSYMTLLLPLVTIALAALLTGDRISPTFAFGGAVILGGVYRGLPSGATSPLSGVERARMPARRRRCSAPGPGSADGQQRRTWALRSQPSSSSFVLRRISSATAASVGSRSKTTARTFSAIGISTSCVAASSSAPVTVVTPSATPVSLVAASGQGTPEAINSPARRLRDSGDMHVAIRSPTPASPANVSGCAPAATPSRVISARPRVMIPAFAESPRPSPSTIPAASATTFFNAPASSTPTRSGLV
jgi:drug/metabolite transporter (DMT)-like permease